MRRMITKRRGPGNEQREANSGAWRAGCWEIAIDRRIELFWLPAV